MSHYEEFRIKMEEMHSIQRQIRLFAIARLTEDNPFRAMIESRQPSPMEDAAKFTPDEGAVGDFARPPA